VLPSRGQFGKSHFSHVELWPKLGSMNFDALRTNLDAVTQFQRNVFAAQLEVGAGVARFVSDRAFDNLAYAAENAATGTAGKLWRSAGCRRYVRGIAEDVRLGRGAVFFVRPGLLDLGEVAAVPIQTTNFQDRCAIVDAVMRRLVCCAVSAVASFSRNCVKISSISFMVATSPSTRRNCRCNRC